MPDRALAPVIGVVLLVAVTVTLAGVVLSIAWMMPPDDTPMATIDGSVDHETNEITLRHAGGDPLHVEHISLRITVDGTPLTHQPPDPSALQGFPSGPFNHNSENFWDPGEASTMRLSSDNAPLPTADAIVEVEVLDDDGRPITQTTLRVE